MSNHILRYNQPANSQVWEEALPLGNGAFGAMLYGGVDEEIIQLNEESVWFGGYRDRVNPDAAGVLEQVRSLIFQGRLQEAEAIAYTKMFGTPMSQGHYEPLGHMKIIFNQQIPHHSEIGTICTKGYSNYKRQLDLQTAIYDCQYDLKGNTFKREAFISYPDQVMVIRLTGKQLSFRLELERIDMCESMKVTDDCMVMKGQSGGGGTAFVMASKVLAQGGRVKRAGAFLCVEGTDEAVILLTGTTDFKEADPQAWVLSKLTEASKLGYSVLKERHMKDYDALYGRVDLYINDEQFFETTDQQMEAIHKAGNCNSLMNLYFNYGRYLLISSSREGGLPANLQGIWNHEMQPPWGCKYTININTQMNYWPAELTNLSECQMPLFEHLKRMRPHGEMVAKDMYNCRGITAHHNTDIYGDCAPQDQWMPATIWPMGMAWLATHLIERYNFTGDVSFVEEYYDILYEAVLFLLDFLIKDEQGRWVTCPTTSPENTYMLENGEKGVLCYGPTMDSQIIRQLFEGFAAISKAIGRQDWVTETSQSRLSDVPREAIGSRGQILEWTKEYDEWEKGHRHISHLYGLYPGNTITAEETPELFEAARLTLDERLSSGGGHTGWSRAWIINFYARLHDGKSAHEHLVKLLQKSTARNLFDMHPPFQIDGNFGGTAGIAEMLLQSHEGFIRFLPALPKAWSKGHVKGLKARGNITVSITWQDGHLVTASLVSPTDQHVRIKYSDTDRRILLKSNQSYEINA